MKKKNIYRKKLFRIIKQALAEEKFLKAMTADEACEYIRRISGVH
jgi:hypothetical protein